MTRNFFDAQAAHGYAERPKRQVPGLESLHRMISMLLGEQVPEDGRVLVLGAGGGLELKALAEAHAGWRFDGIDPSAEMLALARQIVGPLAERMAMHEGYIDAAPEGPFDGAVSLLTFHFIPRDERLETLRQLRRRLRPGAPLLLAHISFPQDEPARSQWIARHAGYSEGVTASGAQLDNALRAMGSKLTILPPEEEEALLAEAGFEDVSLFYAALSFRGWVAYSR
ncbi:class I SAM-dependent methyltransferase [Devosia faecipullorum]|uniref:class I SAM-dependent methyltransferase n=1 Tax=Devosia faecipullorum TaxID=2755039 RepID=UPI00187BBEA6|nr:class I SAM-dependent methyltransferase [Devosia faecipullorum]MBE7732489.1 class I SAM-dependent methyltransferase [Devosia faecipullorum]